MAVSPVDESYSLTQSTTLYALFITLFTLSIAFHYILSKLSSPGIHDKKIAPEAGGAWPLLGYLHLLNGPKPAHLVLAEMADKYGPIFTIRLGLRRAIVVSTSEAAKDCLTTNDQAFATRPSTVCSEVMAYNYAMVGFSPYGPYWRHVRKVAVVELLSNHRIDLLRHVRESEVLASVRALYEQYYRRSGTESVPLVADMKRWFGDITMNVVFRMIAGRRFTDEVEGDAEKGKQALKVFLDHIGMFVVSDGLPFLRWLDLGGYERAMKRTAVEADRVVQRWLEEHKRRRRKINIEDAQGATSYEQQDFMDVMLSILKDDQGIESYDADTVIKTSCLNLIVAGSDTTLVTLIWTLSLLLNQKEALKKAQQELDAQVGKDRRIRESDLKNLPYVNAIIKEALRLYPAAPLSVVHEATEDCTVSGYLVQKGTQLLLNLHKIHRNPSVWPDASEFRPERYLTTHKEIDVRGQLRANTIWKRP